MLNRLWVRALKSHAHVEAKVQIVVEVDILAGIEEVASKLSERGDEQGFVIVDRRHHHPEIVGHHVAVAFRGVIVGVSVAHGEEPREIEEPIVGRQHKVVSVSARELVIAVVKPEVA